MTMETMRCRVAPIGDAQANLVGPLCSQYDTRP